MLRPYQQVIHELAPDLDPELVEGFMREQYGTLDHLSRDAFKRECDLFRATLDEYGEPTMRELFGCPVLTGGVR